MEGCVKPLADRRGLRYNKEKITQSKRDGGKESEDGNSVIIRKRAAVGSIHGE